MSRYRISAFLVAEQSHVLVPEWLEAVTYLIYSDNYFDCEASFAITFRPSHRRRRPSGTAFATESQYSGACHLFATVSYKTLQHPLLEKLPK